MFLALFISFVAGGVCLFVAQFLFVKWWLGELPPTPAKVRPVASTRPALPPSLQDIIDATHILDQPDTCRCLNFILAFIFNEVRDTEGVKRWIMRKMTVEFEEVILSNLAGRILQELTVRDYSIGSSLPTVENAKVVRVTKDNNNDEIIQELDIELSIKYQGGFQMAVDALLVFGKKNASVSVQINRLEGRVRLQFSRLPFTHWSFAFVEEPLMELSVQSVLAGRSVHHLTAFVESQFRRIIRKKHTLPNYKVRHKPFFTRPQPQTADKKVYVQLSNQSLTVGELKVEVVECTRLPQVQHATHLYCTLGVSEQAFKPSVSSAPERSHWETTELKIVRERPTVPIGAGFRDVREPWAADEKSVMVVVARVEPDALADKAGLCKDDIIMSINKVPATSTGQAAAFLRQCQGPLTFGIQRLPPSVTLESLSSFDRATSAAEGSARADDIFSPPPPIPHLPGPLEGDAHRKISQESLHEAPVEEMVDGTSLPSSHGAEARPVSPSGATLQRSVSSSPSGATSQRPVSSSPSGATSQHSVSSSPSGASSQRPASATPDVDTSTVVDGSGFSRPRQPVTESADDVNSLQSQTSPVPFGPNPGWKESFTFAVNNKDNFFNLCVWGKVENSQRGLFIGYVSIPLSDIAIECASVLTGTHTQCYVLVRGTTITAGANRSALRAAGTIAPSKLPASARTWHDREYAGDVLLIFQHTHQPEDEDLVTETRQQGEENSSRASPTESTESAPSNESCQTSEQATQEHTVQREEHAAQREEHTAQREENTVQREENTAQRGEHTAQRGEHTAQRGEHTAQRGEHTAQRGEHTAQRGEHTAQRGEDNESTNSEEMFVRPALLIPHDFLSITLPSPECCLFCHKKIQVTRAERCQGCSCAAHIHCVKTRGKEPLCSGIPVSSFESNEQVDGASGQSADSTDGNVTEETAVTTVATSSATASGEDSDDDIGKHDRLVREAGRRLYTDLPTEQRKEKLLENVKRLQQEIDNEKMKQSDLLREQHQASCEKHKEAISDRVSHSNNKLESLNMLMLQYLSGLHHCDEPQQTTHGKHV